MPIQIDKIIRTNRKTIALEITPDARLIVRAPHGTSGAYINRLVLQKSRWISEKLNYVREQKPHQETKSFKEGEAFLFIGESYGLIYSILTRKIRLEGNSLLIPEMFKDTAEAHIINWYKREARRVMRERLDFYCAKLGFQYKSLRITSARKRWGSCSGKNSINFTWRLVMAPLYAIDYVVVHELVHTIEKNHSRSFWSKVAAVMPDYKQRKNWLNNNQHLMNW